MEFNIGDKVLIERNLDSGCYGAAGKIGFITEEENTNGLIDNGINVKIENSHQIWKVNKDSLTIIKYKSFKKEDLKDGMVVEYRNGCRRMKMGDKIISLDSCHMNLMDYNENLMHSDSRLFDNVKKFDIMKVYDDRMNCDKIEDMINNPKNCIYERKEEQVTKDVSLEEINALLKEKYPNIEKFNLPIDKTK